MALRVWLESNAGEIAGRLKVLADDVVPERREVFMHAVTQWAVNRTVEHTPVREARARGSWVESLLVLGGVPPADWEGNHPNAAAVMEGEEAREVSHSDQGTVTEYRVTSRVPYINYLEYGTRKISAFEMVRQSLEETAEQVRWWDFLSGM